MFWVTTSHATDSFVNGCRIGKAEDWEGGFTPREHLLWGNLFLFTTEKLSSSWFDAETLLSTPKLIGSDKEQDGMMVYIRLVTTQSANHVWYELIITNVKSWYASKKKSKMTSHTKEGHICVVIFTFWASVKNALPPLSFKRSMTHVQKHHIFLQMALDIRRILWQF